MSEWRETEIGLIPNDWDIKKLNELDNSRDAIKTGPFGSLLHSYDYAEEGRPLLLVKNINEGRLIDNDYPLVNYKKANELKQFWLEEGDIVYTRVGAVGRTLYVSRQFEGWMFSGQTLRIRIKNEEVNNRFIELFLRSPKHKKLASQTALGSTRASINTSILANTLIPKPLKEEQNGIVKTISNLDHKIDLLRRQNETLEAIAQTLFKRWFVEFEFPNKEGRPYKSSGGKMVPSELGEIPEGWKVGLSGDIILLQGGFAFKSKDFKKVGKHGIIKIKNIQNQIVDILNTDFVDDEIVQNLDEKFRIKPGDVLIAMTGAEVAKVGIVPQNDSNLWLNQRVGLFKNKINNGVPFIYYLFSKPEYHKALRDKGTGSSAQPNISATDIESIRILVPDISVLNDFAILANPMFNKVISNLRQIQLLAKTCDTLLPKLMSGQIRVK